MLEASSGTSAASTTSTGGHPKRSQSSGRASILGRVRASGDLGESQLPDRRGVIKTPLNRGSSDDDAVMQLARRFSSECVINTTPTSTLSIDDNACVVQLPAQLPRKLRRSLMALV